MKSTKSKWRSVLMPLFLFVLLFTVTACGGQNKSGEKAAGTEGKKTVTVWASGSDNVRVQFDEQIKTFNAAQDKYEAKSEFENYDFISGYCHSYGVNKILQKP